MAAFRKGCSDMAGEGKRVWPSADWTWLGTLRAACASNAMRGVPVTPAAHFGRDNPDPFLSASRQYPVLVTGGPSTHGLVRGLAWKYPLRKIQSHQSTRLGQIHARA